MNNPIETIRQIFRDEFQVDADPENFPASTKLFGGAPWFDSTAVITLITALEDQYGMEFDDDDITAEVFDTLQSLADFVASKI